MEKRIFHQMLRYVRCDDREKTFRHEMIIRLLYIGIESRRKGLMFLPDVIGDVIKDDDPSMIRDAFTILLDDNYYETPDTELNNAMRHDFLNHMILTRISSCGSGNELLELLILARGIESIIACTHPLLMFRQLVTFLGENHDQEIMKMIKDKIEKSPEDEAYRIMEEKFFRIETPPPPRLATEEINGHIPGRFGKNEVPEIDEEKVARLKRMSMSPHFQVLLMIGRMEDSSNYCLKKKYITAKETGQATCLVDTDTEFLRMINYYPEYNYLHTQFPGKIGNGFPADIDVVRDFRHLNHMGRLIAYVNKIEKEGIEYFYTKEEYGNRYILSVFNTLHRTYRRYLVNNIVPFIEMSTILNTRGIRGKSWFNLYDTWTDKYNYVKTHSRVTDITFVTEESYTLSTTIISNLGYGPLDKKTILIPDLYMFYKYDDCTTV